MKLLVDADYVVYKCCAAAETEINWGDDVILVTSKFSDAYAAVKRELLKIINNFLWDVPELVLFFSDSVNFRKSIQPAYKGHRNRKKPCGYKRVINRLKTEYEVVIIQPWRQMMPWVFMPHKIGVSAVSAHQTRTCARSPVVSLTCQK